MSLFQLIYASKPVKPISDSDIKSILDVSRSNNQKRAITGILFFNKDLFIQCLEGDRQAVNETYEKIQSDHRHCSPALLYCQTIIERDFPSWDMHYIGDGRVIASHILKYFSSHQLSIEQLTSEAVLRFLVALSAEYR